MALPPTPIYILCTGSSENIYMKLKINIGISGFDRKIQFLSHECKNYLNEYASYLDSLHYKDTKL